MNRFFCLFATLSVFYLLQLDLVASSSGGSWGGGPASKLNLGVWIPPMTLRLPKFNMPKIKISATIKPRKNQPPMKIHLPEMSLNAKALGDDDNYGGGGGGQSYGGGNSGGYSSGGGDYGGSSGYSNSAPSYGGGDSGYSSGGGAGDYGGSSGYSNSGPSYGGGGSSYSDGYSGPSGGGYRASAASNQQSDQAPATPQNYNNQPTTSYGNNMDYGNRQQDQNRNAYYTVDNQQQQSPAGGGRYQQPESVSYSASSPYVAQSGGGGSSVGGNTVYPAATKYGDRTSYRSTTGSVVQPLSNYATNKREKSSSAYGYSVRRYAVRA